MEDPESCRCQMAAAEEETAEEMAVAALVAGEEERVAEETCIIRTGANQIWIQGRLSWQAEIDR